MKQHITLKELARELDLSVSTVSKALNDSSEISSSTKKRVRELAEIHEYFPNSFAQGLKFKKTKTLGVIVPAILSNFFSMVLDGIEEKASLLGYKVIICISKESVHKEKQAIEMLIRSQVDGILISPSKETQATSEIKHLGFPKRFGIPLVMFDRLLDGIEADKISINDTLEAELATLELINSGCTQVSYFSGISNTSVNENRIDGYTKAVTKNGLQQKIIEVDSDNFPLEQLKKMLHEKQLDGILTSDELTTILTARNILNCNYRIPQDVSLIGFTNGKMGETFLPSLSSIDQKANQQGEVAVHTLIDRIEGRLPAKEFEIVLKADIIHRESTFIPI
ncbi:LacI family DNA-binding transcriptional regulator [Gramella sp. MAR_2010_147]|uniref:LacI family DNA-binding transcriptional regulator n=1 Tax=Gramella sp. MAR_2010_147 TaxID=1250205 RepID=UPI00087A45EC|nr:LacI family DNA-binding transcriptional regulator [Gramella sp. MAR_2010_147]SDS64871.1 transcriptional regulator, LacI family [Gramella sp. MAR_2010_147]